MQADALAALGSITTEERCRTIPVEFLSEPSVDANVASATEETVVVDQGQNAEWMEPIVAYLTEGMEPSDRAEARKIRIVAARYVILEGRLYRRSFTGPLLRCLKNAESNQVLAEIHEGHCGNHSGGRTLAHKAMTQGYYWPTMRRDATEYVQRCDRCQRFGPVPHVPPEEITTMTSPWPFMQWGLDIVGPLPVAAAQRKFVLVATDYFSKWVEAEAYPLVKDKDVVRFIWRNIICRYGLPRVLVADNGSQFISSLTQEFCAEWKITMRFSSPRHPQANGQAESTNKTIIANLKKRLVGAKGRWPEELPGVLWASRTTPHSATGETPFALVYGTEAVIPAEVAVPTFRTAHATQERNDELLRRSLDSSDERRAQALVRIGVYQQRVAKYYNSRVRTRRFRVGDYVLRKVFQNTQELNAGKLGPTWEGPYRITETPRPGAYRLQAMDGSDVPRSWSSVHLRRYYI